MIRFAIQKGTDALALLAMIFIFAASAATGIDVVLRNTIGSPIQGLVDLTQLAMMYAVFFGIAYGFASRTHVAVTVLTDTMSARANRMLAATWWLVGLGLLGFLSYAAFEQATLVITYGDVSQNIRIPMGWYWLPVVAGLGLSACGSLLAVFDTLKGGDANPGDEGPL